ncbi:MAG: hypothetical protein JNL28_11470 [Planctomycetes bacterium]|nr:hypothetical protein [Planctomycetota bacterium]
MDFLLECIGFSPEQPLEELIELVRVQGEAAPWRGAPENHRRLPLVDGLELRIDRETSDADWNILPHYVTKRRLRIAVDDIRSVPDSRFDALLVGWAAPPVREDDESANNLTWQHGNTLTSHAPGAYAISTYLTDARRLPNEVPHGLVLAVSIAGFALDVSYLGADSGASDPRVFENEDAAFIEPLGGLSEPGGCADVSLRIQEVVPLVNPITKQLFDRIEACAPERPHSLFVSRWQLEADRLPQPRKGLRIEGTFMFTGRLAGGLPGPRRTARGSFG